MIIKSKLISTPSGVASEVYLKHLSVNPPNTATFISMDTTYMVQDITELTEELREKIVADPSMEIISE